ncbi:MAG: hypothetical protein KF681_15690 [Bdellovibrionaceae bacterium]|nr:hypothetical protein [Pseudobdellovibrionaceae bacterium]
MDELKFVLKGFVLAIVITIALQVKVGSETLETKSDRLLHESSVGQFLNSAASGAALGIKQGTRAVSQFTAQVLGSSKETKSDRSWKVEMKHRTHQSDESGE